MKSGVYQILNIVTNEKYAGRSKDIERRLRNHKADLRAEKHHNRLLQSAWKTYGEENFVFSIIERCSQEETVQKEQQLIDSGEYAYNISKSALWPHDIVKYTDSLGNIRYRTKTLSEETKQKISAALKKRIKTPAELEQVRMLSVARIGKKVSEAERARLKQIAPRGPAHANFGKQASPERKAAIVRANGTSVHCRCGITGGIITFPSVTQAAKTLRMATDKIYLTCKRSESDSAASEYRGYYMRFIKRREWGAV